ncbi:MAG: hypothetical protein ABSD46_09380 [Bacteroidota bacterium]
MKNITNLLVFVIFTVISVVFAYAWFTRAPVQSKADLYQVSGTLEKMINCAGQKNYNYDYYLTLKDIPAEFVIKYSYDPSFKKSNFESYMTKGIPVDIFIAKSEVNKLTDPTKDIFVFSVVAYNHVLLDPLQCIKTHNKYYPLIAAAIGILIGIGIPAFRFYRLKRMNDLKELP